MAARPGLRTEGGVVTIESQTRDDAKIALAELMIRKAGLIRTVRHEMHKQGVVYFNGLTEILDAIERAKKED
jgi:hypothetical protein